MGLWQRSRRALWRFWTRAQGRAATRLVVTAIVAFEAAVLLGMSSGYSVVLSALIMARARKGSTFKTGLARLAATAVGLATVLATLPLLSLWQGDVLRLVLVVAPLSVLASTFPAWSSALTSALLLLSQSAARSLPWPIAFERAGAVALGCLVSVLVTAAFPAAPATRRGSLSAGADP